MKIFCRIAAVIVCLWSLNFGKTTRQFICYLLNIQDSHGPQSYHYRSSFLYLQNHLITKLVTLQVFDHQSMTANKILLRNFQCKSKLIVYLQHERYKNKIRFNRVTYYIIYGAEIPGPNITNQLQSI